MKFESFSVPRSSGSGIGGSDETIDAQTARQMALRLLDATVSRQAAVLSYNRVFVGVAILFVFALPLVFFLKRGHAIEGEIMVD